MNGQLCRGQREDQPAVPGVHRRESEDLLEEGAIGRRIVAVHDHVGTKDHGSAPLAPIILQSRSAARQRDALPGLNRTRPGLQLRVMAQSTTGSWAGFRGPTTTPRRRFGPNTAEVEAFIEAVAHLIALAVAAGAGHAAPGRLGDQGRARQGRRVATIDPGGDPLDRGRHVRTDGRAPGKPCSRRSRRGRDEKVVAAWQAVSALVMRHQLPALKFAAHYAPFASAHPGLRRRRARSDDPALSGRGRGPVRGAMRAARQTRGASTTTRRAR